MNLRKDHYRNYFTSNSKHISPGPRIKVPDREVLAAGRSRLGCLAPDTSLSTGVGLLHGPSRRSLVGESARDWCFAGKERATDGKFYLATAGYPSDLLVLLCESGELLVPSRGPCAMVQSVRPLLVFN